MGDQYKDSDRSFSDVEYDGHLYVDQLGNKSLGTLNPDIRLEAPTAKAYIVY
jgi:hypothetical protein